MKDCYFIIMSPKISIRLFIYNQLVQLESQVKLLSIEVIITNTSCAYCWHISALMHEMVAGAKNRKNLVRLSQVKLLARFLPNLIGPISTISTNPRLMCISLACSTLLHKMAARAKNRKITCLAFRGQTGGGISTKFHRSDKYHLVATHCCSKWPPKLKLENMSGLTG